MDTIINAHEYLLKFGIKPSVQRIAIMNFLLHNRIHPSVEDIYNALCVSIPTLSKTTVYNTLKLFAEQGALLALVIDEKNVRFDIDTSNHAHFQCGVLQSVRCSGRKHWLYETGRNKGICSNRSASILQRLL